MLYPEKVEVIYYWYHHMMDNELRNHVQSAIDNHDFRAFMLYCFNLNRDNITYLPPGAHIYCKGKYIGEISILNEDAFSMITYSESECG